MSSATLLICALVASCSLSFIGLFVANADLGVIVVAKDQTAALTAIRTAEAQGKDVSGMIANYNTALGLIEKFGSSGSGTCSTSASCLQLQHAKELLQSITDESPNNLANLAASSQQYSAIIVVSSAIGAFAGSLGINYVYAAWKKALAKRTFRTQLRGKDQ